MASTFRGGVGAAILDRRGQVLALERIDRPGSWQLPQGGLEDGETAAQALWRELAEETGLTPADVTIAAEVPEWLGYELPEPLRSGKTGLGQVHKWFVLRSATDDPPVRFDTEGRAEFRAWRWMPLDELAGQVVEFRRAVYRRVAEVAARTHESLASEAT
jgi:putative (di)nucleoside polyphosphate hydrolase